jgi:hypothetical protein
MTGMKAEMLAVQPADRGQNHTETLFREREGLMSWRSAVLGLCAMGLVAMVPVEAGAGVCLVKNGSTCLFWSGSVFCDNANATGLGNVNKDPKSLSCEVNAPGAGLLVCGNPGSKKLASPGIQLVYVPLSFSQVVQSSQSQVDH